MEEFKTLGQSIFQEIDGNYVLKEIYQSILAAYGKKLLGVSSDTANIEVSKALTFADLLSKSVDESRSENHKCWAQEIALLLKVLFPDDEEVQYALGSILSSVSNYRGLQLESEGYKSGDLLERVYDEFKKSRLRIPTEPEKYFFEPQKRMFDGFDNKLFSFSAPTSLGKSFVMQMFIKSKIISDERKNYAIIVPSRALITEVSKNLAQELGTLLFEKNYKIVNSAGATALENSGSNFIFVMTPERLLYLLILRSGIQIDYLFIDEAQKIIKKDGRSTFYYQIVGILSQTRQTHIIFSSPNIPNPEVYLPMIHGYWQDSSYRLRTTFSPVCQEKMLVDLKENQCYMYDDHNEELLSIGSFDGGLIDLVRQLGIEKRNIVYFGSKKKVVEYAKKYADMLNPVNDPELHDLADYIRQTIHKDYYLADLVEKGVAYHNGALPSPIRSRIEDLFKKQDGMHGIKTLFCTSTLLEGVNLPADNLFVADYTNGGNPPMSGVEFRNLMGRVGRIQYNLYGNVVFVCIPHVSTKEGFIKILRTPIPNQELSAASSLTPDQKKTIADCLKEGVFQLPRSITESSEDYAMMRKFMNILLGDIVKGRNSYLLKQFSSFLTYQDIIKIRNDFDGRAETLDDDINVSYDQNEALRQAILEGMEYPDYLPGRGIDYSVLYNFLVDMCGVFKWQVYESDTLGYYNESKRCYSKLRKYAFLAKEWVSGKSMHDIIASSVSFYKHETKEKINECIIETFDIIENIIQFSLTNYFMKFTKVYREIFPNKKFDDWYEFLEYGTYDGRSCWLQRNGFTREAAQYITYHNKRYIIGDGENLHLNPSVLSCDNLGVRNEAQQVYFSNKDLFIEPEEKD